MQFMAKLDGRNLWLMYLMSCFQAQLTFYVHTFETAPIGVSTPQVSRCQPTHISNGFQNVIIFLLFEVSKLRSAKMYGHELAAANTAGDHKSCSRAMEMALQAHTTFMESQLFSAWMVLQAEDLRLGLKGIKWIFSYPDCINNQIFGMSLIEKHGLLLIIRISLSLWHWQGPWNAKCPSNQGERGDSGLSPLWHFLQGGSFAFTAFLLGSEHLPLAAGFPWACYVLQGTVSFPQVLCCLSDTQMFFSVTSSGAHCYPTVCITGLAFPDYILGDKNDPITGFVLSVVLQGS